MPATEFTSGCAFGVDTIGVIAAIRAHVPVIRLTIPTGAWYNEKLEHELQRDKDPSYRLLIERTKAHAAQATTYMARNDLTVARLDVLLAFPPTSEETGRGNPGSGTWATVRRARKAGKEVRFYPLDGSAPWVETPSMGVLL